MSDTNNPEINVEELMGKMREEVAQRRAGNSPSTLQLSPAEISAAAIDWSQVNASLDMAEHHAQVGSFVPSWVRFGRLRRWLARLAARFILYLSEFVTHQQRQFNSAVLQSLYALSDGLRNLESRLQSGFQESVTGVVQAQHEHLDRLQNAFVERDSRLNGHEAAIQAIQESVRDVVQAQQEHLDRLQNGFVARDSRFDGLAAALQGIQESVRGVERAQQEHLDRLQNGFAARDSRLDGLAAALQRIQESVTGVVQVQQEHLDRLQNGFAARDSRLDGLEAAMRGVQVRGLESEIVQRDEQMRELERTLFQLIGLTQLDL
jgi:DNA repair exonuclease SbcCD ATPase subunit